MKINGDLPEISQEECDNIFDNIYNMIHVVCPNDQIKQIRHERMRRYKNDGTFYNRQYGGKKYCSCFKEINGQVCLMKRAYLNTLNRDTLIKIWKAQDDKTNLLISKVATYDLINAIMNCKNTDAAIIDQIQKAPLIDKMPAEDIYDIVNGKIKIYDPQN